MDQSTQFTPATHKDDAVDAEIIDILPATGLETVGAEKKLSNVDRDRQRLFLLYLVVPVIFLTVALLGGLRLASLDNAFVFLRPALICLVFAVFLLVLFVRGRLIRLNEWISEDFPLTKNAANAVVLITLFAASAQLFNSVIPEQGVPFWIVAFCFIWTLWNNLFSEFDNRKLLRSIAAMFGFAFAAKYLVLANLTAPANESWLRAMIENPAQEAVTWLLALPKYSAGTGYIQFFVIVLYFLGLYLLPRSTNFQGNSGRYRGG